MVRARQRMQAVDTDAVLHSAFSTFLLAMGISCGYILRNGPESFTFIYEKWIGFVTASLVMSVVQALYVYARSFRSGALLALGGNSGKFIYDVRFKLAMVLCRLNSCCLVVHWPRIEPLHRLF